MLLSCILCKNISHSLSSVFFIQVMPNDKILVSSQGFRMYAPPVPGSGEAPNAVVRLDIPIDDVVKVRIIYGPI